MSHDEVPFSVKNVQNYSSSTLLSKARSQPSLYLCGWHVVRHVNGRALTSAIHESVRFGATKAITTFFVSLFLEEQGWQITSKLLNEYLRHGWQCMSPLAKRDPLVCYAASGQWSENTLVFLFTTNGYGDTLDIHGKSWVSSTIASSPTSTALLARAPFYIMSSTIHIVAIARRHADIRTRLSVKKGGRSSNLHLWSKCDELRNAKNILRFNGNSKGFRLSKRLGCSNHERVRDARTGRGTQWLTHNIQFKAFKKYTTREMLTSSTDLIGRVSRSVTKSDLKIKRMNARHIMMG